MTVIHINRDHFRAALHTAGDRDIRYYLNGVCVQASATETRVIGTDGACLSVFRMDATGSNDVEGLVSITVPREVVSNIKKGSGKLTLKRFAGDAKWCLTDDIRAQFFDPVEGMFPDYTRVMPRETSGESAQYDAELIAQFRKISVILAGAHAGALMYIKQNGQGAAFVGMHGRTDFAGVLMPRNYKLDKEIVQPPPVPAWCCEGIK